MTTRFGHAFSAIETGVPWPTVETHTTFRGHELTLWPETLELAPGVIVEIRPPLDEEDAVRLLKRFLTALAWVHRQPVRELMTGVTPGAPIRVGKRPRSGTTTTSFYEPYLPLPDDSRARLALALYRQALGLDDVAYECLGYFRVMNVVHTGDSLRIWLETAVTSLTDYAAQQRLPTLLADATAAKRTIGAYLYGLRRCALAHAKPGDPVNPDERVDVRGLYAHQPVIRALAEYVIEQELGIVSAREWRKQAGGPSTR